MRVHAALLLPLVCAALPNLVMHLVDDFGYANVGYHREAGFNETVTPNMDALVAAGVELTSFYVHKYCSPTRSSYQTGRFPIHVNVLNLDMAVHNPADPVSGFAGVPRNMTGIAEKLASAGYQTHFAGKWDAGMASPDHTPKGRGYQTSMLYFHHANDYWTSDAGGCNYSHSNKVPLTPIADLWADSAPAYGLNNSQTCSQSAQAGCTYEDDIFMDEVLRVVAAHDVSKPFFFFWASHIAHAPLQVPQAYLDKFAWIGADSSPRMFYAAMANYVDDLVGKFVSALKAKGMWDNTLWLSSADNGGPIYQSGAAGANNWPKRGGKMSNWQGGINVNAYAAGGVLPAAMRGQKLNGLAHGADLYATFCALAGVDPTDARAAAAGLPPVDGVNLWPYLSGASPTSARTEVPIGSESTEANLLHNNDTVVQGLVRADGWKLLIGETGQNIWQGPYYPNASTKWDDVPYHCGVPTTPPTGKGGCLFNVLDDPTEHNDVAADHPDIVAAMYARILEIQNSTFSPKRGTDDGAACAAAQKYGGFWGPFIE